VVERVREATDIVSLIGAHVALKKMGARLGGLCPFHQEKTPSFYVNPTMQAYHCFGCGVGGDVFSFVMQHEKMTFPEALRYLADQAGIPLPDRRGPSSDQLERIREALRVARNFYRGYLEGARPEGAAGRAYLDGRGIDSQSREKYELGVAPEAWDALLRYARALVSDRVLIESGLAVESSGGRIYDRFRHRLMIPLESSGGSPVGFGGRALGDQEAKYVNSPETPVYRKGSMLFGVAPAREGIRSAGRVVVVEGYFDVIALMQAGVPGVVGTCGTALTPEQATLLKRLSERVLLLFDGDAAGLRAALRALPILAGEVPHVRVAFPPPGIDPDLWVRQNGTEAVETALERAREPLAFLEDLMTAGHLTRAEAARQGTELMARIQDPLSRDLWIQEASGRFGVRSEAFHQALAKMGPRRPLAAGRAPMEQGGGDNPGSRERSGRESVDPDSHRAGPTVRFSPLARACLRTALAHPGRAGDLARAVEDRSESEPELPEILRWLAGQVDSMTESMDEPTPAALLSRAVRELPAGPGLTALDLADGAPPEDPEAVLVLIRLLGVRERVERLQREIRRAQENRSQEEENRLLGECDRAAREKSELTMALSRLGSSVGRNQDWISHPARADGNAEAPGESSA
jgi:DNA primase